MVALKSVTLTKEEIEKMEAIDKLANVCTASVGHRRYSTVR